MQKMTNDIWPTSYLKIWVKVDKNCFPKYFKYYTEQL